MSILSFDTNAIVEYCDPDFVDELVNLLDIGDSLTIENAMRVIRVLLTSDQIRNYIASNTCIAESLMAICDDVINMTNHFYSTMTDIANLIHLCEWEC